MACQPSTSCCGGPPMQPLPPPSSSSSSSSIYTLPLPRLDTALLSHPPPFSLPSLSNAIHSTAPYHPHPHPHPHYTLPPPLPPHPTTTNSYPSPALSNAPQLPPPSLSPSSSSAPSPPVGGGGGSRRGSSTDPTKDNKKGGNGTTVPAKRGRKPDPDETPNRSRDIQRAFRARKASELQTLTSSVSRLSAENEALRSLVLHAPALPPTNEGGEDFEGFRAILLDEMRRERAAGGSREPRMRKRRRRVSAAEGSKAEEGTGNGAGCCGGLIRCEGPLFDKDEPEPKPFPLGGVGGGGSPSSPDQDDEEEEEEEGVELETAWFAMSSVGGGGGGGGMVLKPQVVARMLLRGGDVWWKGDEKGGEVRIGKSGVERVRGVVGEIGEVLARWGA